VGAIPGLAKGTASIELASGAEKATAAKPEALGPEAQGVAAWVESPPQGEARRASANERRWQAQVARTRKK